MMPTLQAEKLRLREGRVHAQGHRAGLEVNVEIEAQDSKARGLPWSAKWVLQTDARGC